MELQGRRNTLEIPYAEGIRFSSTLLFPLFSVFPYASFRYFWSCDNGGLQTRPITPGQVSFLLGIIPVCVAWIYSELLEHKKSSHILKVWFCNFLSGRRVAYMFFNAPRDLDYVLKCLIEEECHS